jgi:hypothetical protein
MPYHSLISRRSEEHIEKASEVAPYNEAGPTDEIKARTQLLDDLYPEFNDNRRACRTDSPRGSCTGMVSLAQSKSEGWFRAAVEFHCVVSNRKRLEV